MLLDDSARKRFETEIDRNFCLSAGAGTGKTTALINRIYYLATQNLTHFSSTKNDPLSRLVVVTYGQMERKNFAFAPKTFLWNA